MTVRIHVSDMLGKRKMNQRELARRTGIRPNTINAMYHETIKRLEVEQLDKLCEALDCQPSDLLSHEKRGS